MALLFPAGALAEGGKSIAGATPITYGQQEFGNTAEGQHLEESCHFSSAAWRSYWNLGVTAGDLITINWEGSPGSLLWLMPIGTTDFNVFQTKAALVQPLSSNNKNQAQYEVPQTGVMPLYFEDCEGAAPGPYNFTVTAQHALVGRLTSPTTILPNSVISASTNLVNGAPAPDGLVFTLSVTWPGGSASYQATSSGGGLSFQLALPGSAEGQTVALVLSRAADAQYREVKSGELRVQVARPQAAAPAPVVKPLRCRRGFRKVRRHGRAICIRAPHRHHRHRH